MCCCFLTCTPNLLALRLLPRSRCSKELNQWEPLTEYGQSKGHTNPYLVLECAWRVSNWTAMKEALAQVNHQSAEWLRQHRQVGGSGAFKCWGPMARERLDVAVCLFVLFTKTVAWC